MASGDDILKKTLTQIHQQIWLWQPWKEYSSIAEFIIRVHYKRAYKRYRLLRYFFLILFVSRNTASLVDELWHHDGSGLI